MLGLPPRPPEHVADKLLRCRACPSNLSPPDPLVRTPTEARPSGMTEDAHHAARRNNSRTLIPGILLTTQCTRGHFDANGLGCPMYRVFVHQYSERHAVADCRCHNGRFPPIGPGCRNAISPVVPGTSSRMYGGRRHVHRHRVQVDHVAGLPESATYLLRLGLGAILTSAPHMDTHAPPKCWPEPRRDRALC